jgi:hypothetical protein
MESLGGSAALAAADLVACERHAYTQELPDEDASVEVLLDTPLARHAADAASSLIAFARALAYTIGQPRAGSREGLGTAAEQSDRPGSGVKLGGGGEAGEGPLLGLLSPAAK